MRPWHKIARWIVTTLLVLGALPIVQLNVERFAEERGWDTLLSDHWGAIMFDLSYIATDAWFLFGMGLLSGGALFMWADFFLRRRTGKFTPCVPHAEITSDSKAAPANRRLPLREVATRAYESLNEDDSGRVARRFSDGEPDEVLNWFANLILGRSGVRIWGRLPPSRDHVLISSSTLRHVGASDGGSRIDPRYGSERAYRDLEIDEDDADHVLRDLTEDGYYP